MSNVNLYTALSLKISNALKYARHFVYEMARTGRRKRRQNIRKCTLLATLGLSGSLSETLHARNQGHARSGDGLRGKTKEGLQTLLIREAGGHIYLFLTMQYTGK